MATIRHETQVANESALRELRDYRKAVWEYIEVVDMWEASAPSDFSPDERIANENYRRLKLEQAEATLRALEERTRNLFVGCSALDTDGST